MYEIEKLLRIEFPVCYVASFISPHAHVLYIASAIAQHFK